MIKRLFLNFICVMLIVFLVVPARSTETSVISLPDNTRILSVIPQNAGSLIVESAGKLFALTPGQSSHVTELAARPSPESAVVAYSDELLLVTKEGGLIKRQSGEWTGETKLSVDDVNRVVMAQKIDELIFASFAMEGQPQAMIAVYDRATGNSRVLTESFGNGWFYPVRQHALGSIRMKDMAWVQQILDVDSAQVTENPVQGLPNDIRAFCYDPGTSTFYFATPDKVLYGSSIDRLQLFSQQGGVRDIAPITQDKVVLLTNDGMIIRTPQSGQSPTLQVLGLAPPFADKYFQETGIKIVERQASVSNMEEIAAMLSTKDASVDLFCLFSDNGLGKIKEKNLFVDLSVSSTLMNAKNELYPAISRRLSSKDSELMAWPVYIESWFTSSDRDILQKYGLSSPETFDELIDLFPKVLESGILPEEPARMFDIVSFNREEVLTYFIQQYLYAMDVTGERPNFHDQDVRRILQKIIDNVPVLDPYPPKDGTEIPLFTLASVTDKITNKLTTGFRISKNHPPAVWSHMQVLVVNPFSPNQEEAIRYLEFLSRSRDQSAYALYASMTDPLPNPQVAAEMELLTQEIAQLEEQAKEEPGKLDAAIAQKRAVLLELASNQYLIDEQSIARYQELATHLYISQDASLLYNAELKTVIAQLAQGSIPVKAFAERMNQIVNLIYLESEK